MNYREREVLWGVIALGIAAIIDGYIPFDWGEALAYLVAAIGFIAIISGLAGNK